MGTEYERKRQENIRRNNEMMAALKVHAKASLLSAATKPIKKKKNQQKKKKKESETPVVTRQSLRTRGLNPDSDGLPDGFSDCPKGTAFPNYVSLRVLAPLPLNDGHTQFVDTISGIARKPPVMVKNEDGDDDDDSHMVPPPPGRFDLGSLCLEQRNVRRVVPERIIVVKFLPCEDVKLIAAGDKDGNVGFWNLDQEDDDGISLFQPHTALVTSLVFQQNSFSKVISSSYDGLIRLMDVEKMVFDLVYSRDEHERIFCLSQRPNDEQSLYFGEGEGMLNIWDLRAGKSSFCQWGLHKYRIYSIDFNPRNPNVMATSSQDGTACLWDLRSMGGGAKKPNTLATVNHAKSVHSAYFSPSGLSLATTSRDNYVGILSGANFEDSSMIYHNNNTDRYISSFRGVWGWDDSYIFVGNLSRGIGNNQTKGIDVISTKLKGTLTKLQSPLMKAVPCRLHCHPLNVGMLAGSTVGGHVYIWTTK